ncbi:peptidoglycan bridge formation glycyltransferase FemA/FemB family protein [Lacinutrix jangbogonensis]|uniref:peptidoglycan bridge formation glycyltransferase FemA/FemB family protein n=1 Tax=Lacinutrix jangbogonensis TaxID=1469557 RepID=UPI00053E193D|nr:peptidoglycan bridge formation glycyltransferase FemA/FemB family protein [Lacinutrix jangbogonensis]
MIEILRDIDDSKFPVFAKKSFLKSRSNEYGWFRDENNNILPFIIDKKLIFRRLIFTNEIISLDKTLTNKTEIKYLNDLIEFIKSNLNVDCISKAQSNAVFNAVPENSISVPWGSYVKPINLPDDELMLSIVSKTRNMVRKATKDNVEVVEASSYDLWHLMNETFKRQGEELIAPSLEYVKKITQELGANMLVLKAVKNCETQGVIGVPFNNETAYYLFGGSVPKPSPGALNLLHFETMKLLRDKGVQNYDFVGARINPAKKSKYYNIQKFKTSFNPILKEGFAFKVIVNPFKYKLMNLSINILLLLKGKKYLGDPIDQILKEQSNVK